MDGGTRLRKFPGLLSECSESCVVFRSMSYEKILTFSNFFIIADRLALDSHGVQSRQQLRRWGQRRRGRRGRRGRRNGSFPIFLLVLAFIARLLAQVSFHLVACLEVRKRRLRSAISFDTCYFCKLVLYFLCEWFTYRVTVWLNMVHSVTHLSWARAMSMSHARLTKAIIKPLNALWIHRPQEDFTSKIRVKIYRTSNLQYKPQI